MTAYILRRILQMIPVFIGVTILLFILRAPGVLPGDPVKMITGEKEISQTLYNQIVEKYGLDKPLYVQYGRYVANLVQGDLGQSYQKGRDVTTILFEKFPNTLKLAFAAILIEMFFGIAAGVISAIKRYSFWDVLVTFSTSVLVSVPVFWFGMLLQILFGIQVQAMGPSVSADIRDEFCAISGRHSPHPAGGHAGGGLDGVCRSHHAQPAARGDGPGLHADGLCEGTIRQAGDLGPRHEERHDPGRHLPRPRPGGDDGRHHPDRDGLQLARHRFEMYHAISQRDWPVVMGGVVIIVLLVMVINLLVDISYAFLDPRIRYGRQVA